MKRRMLHEARTTTGQAMKDPEERDNWMAGLEDLSLPAEQANAKAGVETAPAAPAAPSESAPAPRARRRKSAAAEPAAPEGGEAPAETEEGGGRARRRRRGKSAKAPDDAGTE